MSSLAVASDEPEVFEMESYKDAMELFRELGYTKEK